MKSTFKRILENRAGLFLLFVILLISISTIERLLLLIKSAHEVDFTLLNIGGIFLIGMFYDLINALYAGIPLALYLWLMPQRFFSKYRHQYIIAFLFFLIAFLLIFNGIAEWFFWDEFNARFNFIAVDYLVYSTEVMGNIYESYPIVSLLIGTALLAMGIVYAMRNVLLESMSTNNTFKARSVVFAIYFSTIGLSFVGVSNKLHRFSDNAYVNELAGNGLYELFSAYRNNELDYEQFYKTNDNKAAFSNVRTLLKTPEAVFTSNDPISIERNINNTGPEKKMNVVLISVESFSAEFMEHFGDRNGITPFLDSLCSHSLLFTNLYATGTRTVRGLEALSLCIPPTPGQSIVRRPNNENLFSLGKVFETKGYHSEYIYGGYGYFDNMNYFFGNNGYEVIDRVAIDDDSIHYENIWGVADEDLFTLALKELNKDTPASPVFTHIMTTSNHRPFTYPEGRIDIPSHTGRKGAVKYTDYAIGKFIKEASKQKWFNNTIFIIVADHCASSAGKTELPVDKYHIPMMIYSPSSIQPGTMDRLMSQIDIGPTILGLLNFSYTSKFFGYDMYKLEPGRERAFISTYQSLGYIRNGELVVLSPQSKAESFSLAGDIKKDDAKINEAIAWYQSASYSFKYGLLK